MKKLILLLIILSFCVAAHAEEISDPFNSRVEITTQNFEVEKISQIWLKVKVDRTVTMTMTVEQIGYHVDAAKMKIEKGRKALDYWQGVLKMAQDQAAKVKLGKVDKL